ncbi:hypothetical protein GCM10009069_08630 [Algimonas arctica]|uniref:Peptidase M48 domain-containing protein n=1 Tax=Algimonas arctica TaxID=1479486 RepID=A0A8J3G1L0_9PROT|nr:hypothetical protein GCM10009069_08630 [Algimonas arctica]
MGLCALILAACSDAAADPDMAVSIPETTPAMDRYAEFAVVVARHQAMSERVARISRRLRVANSPLCDVTRHDVGLLTHQLDDYPPSLRALALHFMALDEDGRFIRSVVPGSPADRARLRAGEEIVSGWPFQADQPLMVDNGDGAVPIRLQSDLACVAPAFVINSDRLNASTDGREIELSSALVEQVGDDAALALIIAHEMAHVLRGHHQYGLHWNAELQADADALTLMRNADYDIDGTVAAWEMGVDAHRDSQAMSATHPPLEIRLRNLEGALATLNNGPAGFRPLSDASRERDASGD